MKGMEISAEDILYSIIDINYIKTMGRSVSSDPIQNSDLYPPEWFFIKNLKIKIEVLNEAIEKKCLIKDTESYLNMIEGVIYENNDEEEK